jgi:RHS repeat-associated protein
MNGKLLATVVYKPNSDEPVLNADMDSDGAIGVDDFLVWYFNHYMAGDLDREVSGDERLDIDDLIKVLNCALSGGTAPDCTASSDNRSIYYAHNDHLGTPHMLSDENGISVWSAVYDPFGRATVNEDVDNDGSNVTLNFRFPGQYHDAESGLYYNYFRYYDPDTGRYITSDPIGLDGGFNTYAYVESNPLTRIDPLGLQQVSGPHAYGIRNTYYYGGQLALFTKVPKRVAECAYCMAKKQVLGYIPGLVRDELVGYTFGKGAKSAVKKIMLPLGIATSFMECSAEVRSISEY